MMFFQNESKRTYLDHASITPVDPRVIKAMLPYLEQHFANPSSLYIEGVRTKKALEDSRRKIADVLKAHSDEIIFTASGTEANNLAILGVFEEARKKIKTPHIITTEIEHPSLLEVCREIERRGGKVTYLKVKENGIVDPKDIRKAITDKTVLVSVMYANNEIGTIQPIREITKVIRQFKKIGGSRLQIYFHTDASQAANYLDLNVEHLGVDLMTIDSTKIYGPRGAGFLFCRRRIALSPIIFGGGQEGGRRAGTENVPAAVGLAAALLISEKEKASESKRLSKLRDYFIAKVLKNIPAAILNGDQILRLPNNANFCFPGLDAEFAVFQFDAAGVAISSVTSCRNLQEDSSSYVIESLGRENCAKSSLRFSLGRKTTKKDLDFCLKILYNVINGRTH